MNSPTPKVIVVIPCFNDKDYIRETVLSILNQSFQDFEIIIVDDGSNSETKKVLSTIQHDKLKIISQENKGLSAARNSGFKIAKGEYILTIDSDDTLDSSFLEKAVTILDKEQNVGAVSSYCTIFVKNHQNIGYHTPKGGGVSDFLYDNNSVSFALIRKSCWAAIGGYDEDMKNGFEDWEFWIAMTKKGWKIYTIPDFLFHYRQKVQSMSKVSKMYYRESNLNYIFKKHKEQYLENFEETIDFIFNIAKRNKRNELKYKNSIDYKIGRFILWPLRFIKKLIR